MKQEDKEMICEWLDRFVESIEKAKSNSIAHLEQFKKDNDLLPMDKWNKWLVSEYHPEWLGKVDEKGNLYGLNVAGEPMNRSVSNVDISYYQLATPEQVQERLTKCALKMGYGERQSECLDGYRNEVLNLEKVCYTMIDDALWISDGKGNSNCIMKDGIWADFIPTEIEKIEAKIKKLQEKLNGLK